MSQSSKTWDLAQRSRKVSKGQAKIFLTRSAGEEQRLAKLTKNLDKEKAARESEMSYAQKLLLKRYGGGKVDGEAAFESRVLARDRSQTDPTFITRSHEITGRARTASGLSFDLDDRSSTGNTRGPSDIPRVHSQGNVTILKDKDSTVSANRKISFSIGDLLRDRSNCSHSEGEIYKTSNGTQHGSDLVQERRLRAVSEVLPPISLPPIYKTDDNLRTTGISSCVRTGVVLGGNKSSGTKGVEIVGQKVLPGHTRSGRKTSRDSCTTEGKTMNNELDECRYLRTSRNFVD